MFSKRATVGQVKATKERALELSLSPEIKQKKISKTCKVRAKSARKLNFEEPVAGCSGNSKNNNATVLGAKSAKEGFAMNDSHTMDDQHPQDEFVMQVDTGEFSGEDSDEMEENQNMSYVDDRDSVSDDGSEVVLSGATKAMIAKEKSNLKAIFHEFLQETMQTKDPELMSQLAEMVKGSNSDGVQVSGNKTGDSVVIKDNGVKVHEQLSLHPILLFMLLHCKDVMNCTDRPM